MSASDRDLLRDYAHRGSEAAFRELVSRYASLVYATAFRPLQDGALAEDVAQVTFVRLAQAAPTLDERVNIAGWLYRTARHVSLHSARTRCRQERRVQEHAGLSSVAPDDETWNRLASEALDPALEGLDEPDREILLLRFYRGMKYREVAKARGISEAAAKMRVARALARLESLLRARGIVCPGAAAASMLGGILIGTPPASLAATVLQRVELEGFLARNPAVPETGGVTMLPALSVGLGITVCLVSAVAWLGWRSPGRGESTPAEPLARETPTEASLPATEIARETNPDRVPVNWSSAQWRLWEALTAPLPTAPEMRQEAGLWVHANISSPTRLTPVELSRRLHAEGVRTALSGLVDTPAAALEVLRSALQSKDPLVVEESVGALGQLGRDAEPLLDEVLTLLAGGRLSGVPMHVLAGALPHMGAPEAVTGKLLGLLSHGENPAQDAARLALLMVLQPQHDVAGKYLGDFVRLAHADHPRVQLTGLGLVGFCAGTASGLARLEAEHPGLRSLLPLVDLIHRKALLDDEAIGDADRMALAWNARRALAALDRDPATTAAALKEMLPLAPSAADTDWMIAALCVLDPEAAADPQITSRLERMHQVASIRARAQTGNLSSAEAVAALEDRETISEATEALVTMGPQARDCVPTLVSQLGTWRDYFILKVLRAVQPDAMLTALNMPVCAGEAAVALGELGRDGVWALPALRAALNTASPDSAELIVSAIATLQDAETQREGEPAIPISP